MVKLILVITVTGEQEGDFLLLLGSKHIKRQADVLLQDNVQVPHYTPSLKVALKVQ
jgi:hypothetical protein